MKPWDEEITVILTREEADYIAWAFMDTYDDLCFSIYQKLCSVLGMDVATYEPLKEEDR